MAKIRFNQILFLIEHVMGWRREDRIISHDPYPPTVYMDFYDYSNPVGKRLTATGFDDHTDWNPFTSRYDCWELLSKVSENKRGYVLDYLEKYSPENAGQKWWLLTAPTYIVVDAVLAAYGYGDCAVARLRRALDSDAERERLLAEKDAEVERLKEELRQSENLCAHHLADLEEREPAYRAEIATIRTALGESKAQCDRQEKALEEAERALRGDSNVAHMDAVDRLTVAIKRIDAALATIRKALGKS